MPTCPYCGKDIKPTDKFCLYCGEPLLKTKSDDAPEPDVASHQDSGTGGIEPIGEETIQQEKDATEGLLTSLSSAERKGSGQLFPDTEITPAELQSIEDELKEEDKPFVPDELDTELDPAIKMDIQARIDYHHLGKKIKIVKERLKESISMLEDPDFKKRYDFDDDFRKQNAIRLEALRQIAQQLKKQKEGLESKMSKDMPLMLKNMEIKRLKNQLVELNNSFRMRRIERKPYDKLHSEYSQKLKKALASRKLTNTHLKMWVSRLKTDQEELRNKIELLKGRKASREINKKTFKEKKAEIEKEIEKIGEDISIVEKFIFKD
ncbi:zinc-ribbon domain-containing protein [Candidatus Bathyarchaeota archaeon]|nr:zinc-ribbon domain-containing protein [Candidatus Bathyarchaeota archaeon]